MGMYGTGVNTPIYPSGGSGMYAPPIQQAGIPNAFGPMMQPYGGVSYGAPSTGMPGGYGTMPMNNFFAPMTSMSLPFNTQPMVGGLPANMNYPYSQTGFGTPGIATQSMPFQPQGFSQSPFMQQGLPTAQMPSTYYPSAADIGITNPFMMTTPGSSSALPQGNYPQAQQNLMPTEMNMPGASPQMDVSAMSMPTGMPMDTQALNNSILQAMNNPMAQEAVSPFASSRAGISSTSPMADSQSSVLEQRMMAELMRDPELAILWILVKSTQSNSSPVVAAPVEEPISLPDTSQFSMPEELPSVDISRYQSFMQPQANPYENVQESEFYMDPSRYDGAYGSSSSLYNSSPLSKALETYRSTYAPGFSMNGELTASAQEAAALNEEIPTTPSATPPAGSTTTTPTPTTEPVADPTTTPPVTPDPTMPPVTV